MPLSVRYENQNTLSYLQNIINKIGILFDQIIPFYNLCANDSANYILS
jgi:hypothetical protein